MNDDLIRTQLQETGRCVLPSGVTLASVISIVNDLGLALQEVSIRNYGFIALETERAEPI